MKGVVVVFDLGTIYRPLTAVPFEYSKGYCEIEPCDALKPYVRCFWGTPDKSQAALLPEPAERVIIPDTCMDIIFNIDYAQNRIEAGFCALDESTHLPGMTSYSEHAAIFAIRFYAWSAILFAEHDLKGSKNCCFDAGKHFSQIKNQLEPMLYELPTVAERVSAAQKVLLARLDRIRMNSDLMNAIYYIISTCGRERISQAAVYTAVSEKQLERIFAHNIGISPKSFSSLVRYQLLWQEIARCGIVTLDAVEKYGYFDQAHLINDFRKRHLCTPMQAAEGLRAGRFC